MSYQKIFDPPSTAPAPTEAATPETATTATTTAEAKGAGDRRDGLVYVYDPEGKIVLAVNVALAAGRPLLVLGPSGCGKSTLAKHIAKCLGWRYYEEVITSQTRAGDLMWRFDAVRRLSDAQTESGGANPVLAAYINPAALWWAFSPQTARFRGAEGKDREAIKELRLEDPSDVKSNGAVVLLDEIDKADPDTPNNLLVTLGSWKFKVQELEKEFEADRNNLPLVVITSNRERSLPEAFVRRCVTLNLPEHDDDSLLRIASQHFPDGDVNMHKRVATYAINLENDESRGSTNKRKPSAAEYIDAVYACQALKPEDDGAWSKVLDQALVKKTEAEKEGA